MKLLYLRWYVSVVLMNGIQEDQKDQQSVLNVSLPIGIKKRKVWSVNRAKRDIKSLGMTYGKASGILKKQLFLIFLSQLNLDFCYRCSKKIETPEELSIDHKVNWRYDKPELFWDLNNIAYSHRLCNVPANRSKEYLKKIGPEGTCWCGGCKDFLSVDLFHKNSRLWTGYNWHCIECRKKLRKIYKRG